MVDTKELFQENNYELWHGDCLVMMDNIPNMSVDMIFTDLPYNTTQNSWDCFINLDELWKQYKRVIKKNGCIALWAQAPFSHMLAMSNFAQYRYEWIIEKTRATGHLNAKRMPMKAHENIMIFGDLDESPETLQIFYGALPTYNPQMTEGHEPVHNYTKHQTDGSNYGKTKIGISGGGSTQRYPRDVLYFPWDTQRSKLHPCQKPLDVCELIIKTYTNEGDTVLDSCMGSNTTGLACKNLNRKYIGIEKEEDIFEIARERMEGDV